MSRPTSRALLALATLSLTVTLCASATAAAAPVRIGEAPPIPAGVQALGPAPETQELQLYVALEPRDPAGLEAFATAVSTPGTPRYGDYLSVAEFAARFGATPAQVATVRRSLAARGLEVGPVAENSLSLPVTATVGEAEEAFGIEVDHLRTASGRVAFANDRAPAIAAAAAPFVQGVLGLSDVAESHRHDGGDAAGAGAAQPTSPAQTSAAPLAAAFPASGPQPCKAALDQQKKDGGYTANQIAAAYGIDDLHSAGNYGAGETVALLEMEPYGQVDIDAYQQCFGTDVEVTAVDVKGGPGPFAGEDGEAALDIEQVIGQAPAAKIVVYQGPNPSEAEIISAWVEDNVAKVMSSSWGICEKEVDKAAFAAVDTLLQEAAAQGQSFFVAAGDYGSTDCFEKGGNPYKGLNVDFPGSDPWATDVGGTRLETPDTAPTDYLWNDSEEEGWGAGGSGVSEHFPMASYQRQAAPGLNVLGELSGGAKCGFSYCRQVPDVSAQAADYEEAGYVIHAGEAWETNGGTSAAAPLWAAIATLVNADPSCGGKPIGFANPALYAVAGSDYAANFRDVTTHKPGGRTTTNIFESSNPYPAGPGYDMATGLGAPVAPGLASSLCAVADPPASPVTPAAKSQTTTPPQAAVAAPSLPTLSRAALTGVTEGKPKLVFTVTARPGARLRTVTIETPPALKTDDPSGRIRFQPKTPRPSMRLKVSYPNLRATPKLLAHIRSGVTKKLGLVVSIRETGNKGARLPLILPVD